MILQVCHAAFCHSMGGERWVWRLIRWQKENQTFANISPITRITFWKLTLCFSGLHWQFSALAVESVSWWSGRQASRCWDAWARRSSLGDYFFYKQLIAFEASDQFNTELPYIKLKITHCDGPWQPSLLRRANLDDFLVPPLPSGTELSGSFWTSPFRIFINITQWYRISSAASSYNHPDL